MAEIRGYVAATLDGYIASADGGIDWLEQFGELDYGYDQFIADIDTVVIGRKTYDQVRELLDWPYSGKNTIIVSHRSVDGRPPQSEVWSGSIGGLVARLRAVKNGDVWVIGGSQIQQQFLDAGALDRIEVHVIPLLLGSGVPLWPESPNRHRLALKSAAPIVGGMVRLEYTIGPGVGAEGGAG